MIRRPRFTPPLGPPRGSARQRVLASWRGLDVRPVEISQTDSARSTKDLLPSVLNGLRMDDKRKEAEIVRVWNHLIDPVIVKHAQPTGLHKGTLFVSVDSSVWLDEIVRYRRRDILNRMQHSFGRKMIARISFRVG